jgi:Domain of unknown function (DUF4304)
MLPLESAIAPELKARGFKKKGRTWWRDGDVVIQVLNLQQSPFGDQLYVNLGVYLKRLGSEAMPAVNRCHIGVRLDRAANHHAEVASATVNAPPGAAMLSAVLVDGIAWFESVSTIAGIRSYLASGGASKGLVFASVRELAAEKNDA